MSKVYNRVEWAFLKKLLEKLGFDNRWIALISSCIHFVSFFFMVNGAAYGHFTPNRGLCQGDPLFPYLFLLCAEGLHSLIQLAKDFGTLHGVSLCRAGPKVSHLFFVDNSLLFCKASQNDCNNILEILQLYESASGQQINKNKTQLFFSSNTGQDMQAHVKNSTRNFGHYTHWVLPSFVGRGKEQSLNYFRERIWHKMQGWKEKLLSQWGREILIKAVLQAPWAVLYYQNPCARILSP